MHFIPDADINLGRVEQTAAMLDRMYARRQWQNIAAVFGCATEEAETKYRQHKMLMAASIQNASDAPRKKAAPSATGAVDPDWLEATRHRMRALGWTIAMLHMNMGDGYAFKTIKNTLNRSGMTSQLRQDAIDAALARGESAMKQARAA